MKKNVAAIGILLIVISVAIGAAEVLKKQYFSITPPSSMGQLDRDTIISIKSMNDINDLMLRFSIDGTYYNCYGYIFPNNRAILYEGIDTIGIKDQIESERSQGQETRLPSGHIRLLQELPYAEEFTYYRSGFHREEINNLLDILLLCKKYDPAESIREPLNTGLSFHITLYFNDKAALFEGEAYTGDSTYDINQDLIDYLRNVLLPHIKENGEKIKQSEFRGDLIDELEGHPWAEIWAEGS